MAGLNLQKMQLFLLAFLPLAYTQCTTNNSTADVSNAAISIKPAVAPGYKWSVVASNITFPRSIDFDSQGRLIVLQAAQGLTALDLTADAGVCVREKSRKTFVNLPSLIHGLSFSKDKSTIYASATDQAYSWTYDPTTITASNQETLVKGMNNSDHITRTLLKSRFNENMLLVSRGSNENIDPGAAYLSSGRSQIRAFDLSKVPNGGYDYTTSGIRLGWGLRNSVGVGEHPITGGIYSVENSADDVKRNNIDVHQNNPAEELNFHGTLMDNRFQGQGGNYGYPNCFATWDAKSLPDNQKLTTGSSFANASALDYLCEGTISPRLTFQAHMAPLDIKFDNTGKEAWVSFHGSFDRDEFVGYKVSKLDFTNGSPDAAPDSQDALHDILTNTDNSKCPTECFRPAGLAFDNSGRLFFSSDRTNEIYVIAKD